MTGEVPRASGGGSEDTGTEPMPKDRLMLWVVEKAVGRSLLCGPPAVALDGGREHRQSQCPGPEEPDLPREHSPGHTGSPRMSARGKRLAPCSWITVFYSVHRPTGHRTHPCGHRTSHMPP